VVVDEIYKKTIEVGIVDHHSIDTFMAARGIKAERCSTKMVADFPEAVLRTIKENAIDKVQTHFQSDLDAVVSAYFVKHLIENGQLPDGTETLAELVNKIDYGRSNELGPVYGSPESYPKTLLGTFLAIKSEMDRLRQEEFNAKGFNPALFDVYEAKGNAMIFELLNKVLAQGIDVMGDISSVDSSLSQEIQVLLPGGRENVRKGFEKFNEEFGRASILEAKVNRPDGSEADVGLIIASSPEPLGFTNMAYTRVKPETIVAVFAGKERNSGDNYDIGIMPDQAKVIDMRGLCLALNTEEQKKRSVIIAKTERTADEQALVDGWAGQKDREAFSGLNDMIGRGEVVADSIPVKDPTVLVAGGSLIAASRTSLLTEEDFRRVLLSFVK